MLSLRRIPPSKGACPPSWLLCNRAPAVCKLLWPLSSAPCSPSALQVAPLLSREPFPQPQASAPFPGVAARRVFHSLPGALAERREVLHPAFALTASGTGRACFGGWAELMKLGDKGLSGEGCRIVPFPFKPFLGLCATCQTPYTLTLVPPSRHEPLGVVCACAPWELHVCGSGGWFWGGEGCRL